jgi:Domain of unknown function (DUF4118)
MYPTGQFEGEARYYGFGLAVVVIAVAIKHAFDPLLGTGSLFLLFSAAVLMAAWFGGSMPGLATTLLAGAASGTLLPPQFSFGNQPGESRSCSFCSSSKEASSVSQPASSVGPVVGQIDRASELSCPRPSSSPSLEESKDSRAIFAWRSRPSISSV